VTRLWCGTWCGTDSSTGKKIEVKGFVLWRLADGKIAERWATITPYTFGVGTFTIFVFFITAKIKLNRMKLPTNENR